LLNRNPLQCIGFSRACQIAKQADLAFCNLLVIVGAPGARPGWNSRGIQHELAYLLVHRHSPKQGIDAALDSGVPELALCESGSCNQRQSAQHHEELSHEVSQ
jgi:hypothetical protein